MLKVFLLFILLIAGIVLGPMLAGHQGYVLIQTDNYNIETSVTGLVIILIPGVVVLLAVEWLLRRIFRTGVHTRGWFVGRKRRRARKQTEQALLKLAEGDYQQVEKLMSKNADHAEQPVVNYLLAAEAAQQRGDEARANQHLERASELSTKDPIPVEITRVRLQLARNENHAARHGVDRLLEITLVIRKCCVLLSRHIFGPVHGARCWTLSLPWRKPTWVMMNIVMNFSVWPGLA